MPAILALFIRLLPSLVAIAELIFNKPKAGEEKKGWILSIFEAAMRGADTAFTGGAAETWAEIRPEVSKMIDGAAAIAFPKSPGTAQSMIDAQR
jgi:hypothetical protein